jgi:DNA-binding transcriptional regulator YdaS (Cro superfamily)
MDMSYDSITGVNKKWLVITTQMMANSIVKWLRDDSHQWPARRISSFELAIRKYPKGNSFLCFPIDDIDTLLRPPPSLTTIGYNINTLQSISLVINMKSDLICLRGLITEFYQLLSSTTKAPAFRSLTIERVTANHVLPQWDNNDVLKHCYRRSSLLLHHDQSRAHGSVKSSGVVMDEQHRAVVVSTRPNIRFNGELPVRCSNQSNHEWTFQTFCQHCQCLICLSCVENDHTLPLNICYPCGDYMVDLPAVYVTRETAFLTYFLCYCLFVWGRSTDMR